MVLAFRSPDKQYALIVDASTGAKDYEGGLGANLTQMDAQWQVFGHLLASRLPQDEEKNLSPFLLEMRDEGYLILPGTAARPSVYPLHRPQTTGHLCGSSRPIPYRATIALSGVRFCDTAQERH